MPFTVEEFRDLLRILEERPEWRAELRRIVLTDALLTLPELVRSLAEAQARTEIRLGRLEEVVASLADAQARTEIRLGRLEEVVASLADAQRRTEIQVASLAEAQRRTAEQLADLTTVVRTVVDEVGELKGHSLERRYYERASAYFARMLRRTRALSDDERASLLEGAVARRALSEDEAEEVALADVVVRGRRREDDLEVYLVVEVSWGVGVEDVRRAARRAALLSRSGILAVPVVAGQTVIQEAAELAHTLHVWQLKNGHAIPPESPGG